jgi:MoxR-like ATPase
MRGRDYALPQDLQDVAPDILRHRLVLSYDALADGVPAEYIIERVLATVPMPTVSPRQSADLRGPSPVGFPPPGGPTGQPPAPHLGGPQAGAWPAPTERPA